MLTRFDHVVLGVTDLKQASKAFEDAGFDVFDRGSQSGPMENRLIRFPDWSFIELVAFREVAQHRFWEPVNNGGGWIDYALCVNDMAGVHRRLKESGVPVGQIRRVSQPSGNGGNWEMDLLLAGLGVGSPALPFLTEDLTPLELRLPRLEPGRQQPGGASGIAGATIVVSLLATHLADVSALCGEPSSIEKDEDGNAQAARFEFGGRWLEFIVPAQESEAAARLKKAGAGLFSVTLRSSGANAKRLTVGDALGAILLL